jgi:hypothetical protein
VTTEEEDIIYCLLGVLSVSMSTTYREGKESALRRLKAEVETARSVPSIIPFSQNESFIGRELQLAKVEAKLFTDGQSGLAAQASRSLRFRSHTRQGRTIRSVQSSRLMRATKKASTSRMQVSRRSLVFQARIVNRQT